MPDEALDGDDDGSSYRAHPAATGLLIALDQRRDAAREPAWLRSCFPCSELLERFDIGEVLEAPGCPLVLDERGTTDDIH
jgi:hypothetical protein